MDVRGDEEGSYFERERERLIGEVTAVRPLPCVPEQSSHLPYCQGFEELLPLSNLVNRKLEELLSMTKEYESTAALWNSFHMLMRRQKDDEGLASTVDSQPQGLPGTGGHTLKTSAGSAAE